MPPINSRHAYATYRQIGDLQPKGIGIDAYKKFSEQECQLLDVAWWYGAMTYATAGNISILRRLFAVIWHGGLYYRPKHGTWKPWSQTGMPIATALSRSGGVVVQYEDRPFQLNDQASTLWRWIFAEKQPDIRSHATHGIEFGNYGVMPNGRPKNYKENKKDNGGHFGINLAGGGLGNRNIITGNRILEDGRHGHLYFCHTAASAVNPGGFLVKAESSAPLDTADGLFWNSPFWRENPTLRGCLIVASPIWLPLWTAGAIVDTVTLGGIARQPVGIGAGALYPQAQTGDFHALGVSGERGITGGRKFKETVTRTTNVPYGDNGYDVMFVNPSADTVDRLIRGQLTFDIDDLGRSPPPPAATSRMTNRKRVDAVLVAALQDVIKKYEKESSGFFSRSSAESQRVMTWIRDVVATNAANVHIGILPGVSRVQPGDSHLLWTLRYYVNGQGESAENAPHVTLTKNGRLHQMLAEVVVKGQQASDTL